MKIIKATTFSKKTYNKVGFENKWYDSFGNPPWSSRWLLYGDSGVGKTEFCCQLAKYMSNFGKVIYASAEQKDDADIQQSWKRNRLLKLKNVYLAIDVDFKGLLKEIKKRGRSKLVIIDSIDYVNITVEQYKVLNDAAKKHFLVFVSWADGKKPKSQAAKDILYMCNSKLYIDYYLIDGRSRSGGNSPYIIWLDKAKEKHAFLNR